MRNSVAKRIRAYNSRNGMHRRQYRKLKRAWNTREMEDAEINLEKAIKRCEKALSVKLEVRIV